VWIQCRCSDLNSYTLSQCTHYCLLLTQLNRAALTESDEASVSSLALLGARLALGGPLLGIACGVVGSFALGNLSVLTCITVLL
jgi:hypothetical protein